ncbi:C-C chemokine receptor type 6-like [Gambusia affinis]|uniref:C-C chemokine receptor type 6-like n=1 Tax=Gambusia affinis TaxID=33528 RepID=UPI001CDD2EE1|nr:C-C chemokine receptor type 6-like [Gambusia affinis]XP_043963049.1 C-C chemokine receptor type 6-like [Gambusia affinis]XP_043963050.1 C-C chemokine receptor type 6-like [Gambusia affinis]
MNISNDPTSPPYEYDYNYPDYGPCPFSNNNSVNFVVGPYIHSIICILGLVGNSLVILTYALYKRTKSMTDVYLLNVAIADLLFVLALPFIVYNELYFWPMGQVACKLLRGSYSVNLYSGMLMLACISTDRYIAIVQARRSFRLRSVSNSRIICFLIWIFSLLVSVPTFHFYHWYEPSHHESTWINSTEEEETTDPQYVCEWKFDDSNTASIVKVAVPSTQLAIGFFLPLLIMIFCYTSVIITLQKAKNFQRHKAVRVVMVVVLVFIACHLPYNLALLYETVSLFKESECDEVDSLKMTMSVLQTVAYLHCCLNPLLYAFIGVKFRNHFRRIFRDLWCLGKRYIAPRRFSRVTSDTFMSTIRRSVDGSSENGTSFTM